MMAFSDYPQLTKINKTRSNNLKKAIFEVSQKLGSGITNPVPYDTAWVARIPKVNGASPAFPECLQWLRDHQLEDGSWGEDYPLCLCSKVLNTFAAVLAFCQWNFENDQNRIQKGVEALNILSNSLTQEETNENGFEMIISTFLDDACGFNLKLAYKQFEWCNSGKEKLQKIRQELLSNKPNKYWSFLEVAGTMDLDVTNYKSEITKYGLISAQPSTTAFILRYARLRGSDFPEAEWTLKHISDQYQGGIPHVIPIDNFEIIHGLDFFFKAGIDPKMNVKHAATQRALSTLIRRFDLKEGIGISSNWFDTDTCCTVAALNILRQSSNIIQGFTGTGNKTILSIEETPFVDVNYQKQCKSCFNPLIFGSVYHPKTAVDIESNNIIPDKFDSLKKTYMTGMQNISQYYSLLQYVFSITTHEIKISDIVQNFLGKTQNKDGGWGGKIISSAEETAYVCLALFRLIQIRKDVLECIDFHRLVKFMDRVDSLKNTGSLWCYKVSFRSEVLTEAVIAAGKYGLFQIQRLCMFTDALNNDRLEFLNFKLQNENGELLCEGIFQLTRSEVQLQDIEVSKMEVENITKNILKTQSFDAYMQKLFEYSLNFSYLKSTCKASPYIRAMDTLLVMVLFAIDDYIDLPSPSSKPEVDKLMQVVCEIFRGDHETIDVIPAFDLPRIEFIWRWCFECKKMMAKNNWNAKSFVTVLENWVFKHFSLQSKLYCYGIEPTSGKYLKIAKGHVGLVDCVHFLTLLQDNTTDSTEFDNDDLFLRFKDCACKAARLLNDIPTVSKDLKCSQPDNYCLALMQEYNLSLSEAMMRAIKKFNKEILKMCSLKRMILSTKSENLKKLEFIMINMEHYVQAAMFFSLNSVRYETGHTHIFERVPYARKDLVFTYDLCFSQC